MHANFYTIYRDFDRASTAVVGTSQSNAHVDVELWDLRLETDHSMQWGTYCIVLCKGVQSCGFCHQLERTAPVQSSLQFEAQGDG